MDISVLLCVHDDVRIINCLNSIDVPCEAIVVANNATEQVLSALHNYDSGDRFDLRIIEIPEKGIGRARDVGAENAKYDKMLFLDSDCRFLPGGIGLVSRLLDDFLIVDGKIQYEANSFQSRVVSKCRTQSVPDRVFCPGLSMRKEVKPLIGGYFFDRKLGWLEDSEINKRFQKASVPIGYTEKEIAVHAALTFSEDLNSAFKYGMGRQVGIKNGVFEKKLDAIFHLVPSYFKLGFFVGLYLFAWNISYTYGYIKGKYSR